MAGFAERMGYRESRTVIQRESLDDETRIALWNAVEPVPGLLDRIEQDHYFSDSYSPEHDVVLAIWTDFFKRPRDEMRSTVQAWQDVKQSLLAAEWYDSLEAIEALVGAVKAAEQAELQGLAQQMAESVNSVFERMLVGYRFVGLQITPVDSAMDAEAIADGLSDASVVAGARHALDQAVDHLSDRQNPDYPNSIKESISAVESVVKKVTGKGELSKGLAELERAGLAIHPALKMAWLKMYGWTSADDGIRHGGIDAADADQALAKYMLVTCSAFVSYLVDEGRKKGLV